MTYKSSPVSASDLARSAISETGNYVLRTRMDPTGSKIQGENGTVAKNPTPVECTCESSQTVHLTEGLCARCTARRLLSRQPEGERLPIGYEWIARLGQGGMGVVHLAYQQRLSRYVALKQLLSRSQDDRRARMRLLREAEAAAKLSHPNIVPIWDLGMEDGLVWYSMEYLEGGDLSDFLAQNGGALPWQEARILFLPICSAVEHAHRHGVAHRDLKPGNILLSEARLPKVADFGIAWIAGSTAESITLPGELIGTPAYMSPEAARGRSDYDPAKNDVYSLAAVLYHMLGGCPPFARDRPVETLAALFEEEAPRLTRGKDQKLLPPHVTDALARCLSRNPAERFSSAAEMAHYLENPPSSLRRQIRRSRRPRFALSAATLATLAAAGAWFFFAGTDVPSSSGEALLSNQVSSTTVPSISPVLNATPVVKVEALLAVLPFESDAGDPVLDNLATGLHAELINSLTRITDLPTISARTAAKLEVEGAQGYRDLNALGITHLVNGRLQRDRDLLRVWIELVDQSSGTVRWSQSYTRRETLLFNLQSEIATELAIALRAQFRSDRDDKALGTRSGVPLAQENFLKALAHLRDASASKAQLLEGIRLLEVSVAADPQFARAYALLSQLHTQLYNWGDDRSDERLHAGLRSAQEALRINPGLPDGLLSLGLYYARGFRDWSAAKPLIQRVVEAEPNNVEAIVALANITRREGNFETSAELFARAVKLDPLNAVLAYNAADTLLRLRRYHAAADLLNVALVRVPRHVALIKLRGDLHAAWEGNLDPMRMDLLSRDSRLPKPELYLMDKVEWLILENRLHDALAALQASSFEVIEGQTVYITRAGYESLVLRWAGRSDLAVTQAERALDQLAPVLNLFPNDSRILMQAAMMHAVLGNRVRAKELAERVFTPGDLASADAFDRGLYLHQYALALTLLGDLEQARHAVMNLLNEPNQSSIKTIQLHPGYAALRSAYPFDFQ